MQRPKLKLHGAWCFGHTFQLAILEENTVHGSSMVQEVLMRTLETVMKQCKDCHQPPPNTLVVVGDNTVKELKNSVCLSYLASLVNHGRLQFLAPLASFCFYALIIIVLVNHCLSFSIFLLLCLDNYCVCQPLFVNHYCSWSKMIQTFKKNCCNSCFRNGQQGSHAQWWCVWATRMTSLVTGMNWQLVLVLRLECLSRFFLGLLYNERQLCNEIKCGASSVASCHVQQAWSMRTVSSSSLRRNYDNHQCGRGLEVTRMSSFWESSGIGKSIMTGTARSTLTLG